EGALRSCRGAEELRENIVTYKRDLLMPMGLGDVLSARTGENVGNRWVCSKDRAAGSPEPRLYSREAGRSRQWKRIFEKRTQPCRLPPSIFPCYCVSLHIECLHMDVLQGTLDMLVL